MPLYRCTNCDVIENTATGRYWEQQMNAYKAKKKLEPICSQCLTGEWHGEFPREGITAEWLQGPDGFVWRPHEAATVPHMGPFKPVSI